MVNQLQHAIIRAVYDKTGGHCWYCGLQLNLYHEGGVARGNRYFMEIDHALPRSRGGGDDLNNLLPACPRCNSEKNKRTVEEYRLDITRHLNGVPKFRAKQVRWLESVGFSFPHYPLHQFWAEQVQP